MTKRTWSEAKLNEPPSIQDEVTTVVPEEGKRPPVPSGISTPEGEVHQSEDVAANEGLPAHPFWDILSEAGYTLW